MDFEKIIPIILQNEGVYSNDPNDPGGETYFGISRKYFPNWPGWRILDQMQNKFEKNFELFKLVKQFYKENFWDKMKLDEINNFELKKVLMDTAVNIGKTKTIKLLQSIVNVEQDGIIGPKTIEAVNNACELIPQAMKLKRIEYYKDLIKKNPKLKKYFYGWVRRTCEL